MYQYKNLVNKYSKGRKITDEELKDIQKGLIFLLREIMEVCNKYDIKPFLAGGNLLGKIRHDGFIPWDDDLDLCMLRDDYNKFVSIFDKELSDRYVISAPFKGYQATNRFVQVGRKGTVLQSADATSDSEGIVTNHLYVDIFPFDYAPNNVFIRTLRGIKATILMGIAGSVSFVKERNKERDVIFKHSLRGRIELYSRIIVGTLFSFKSVTNWMIAVNNVAEDKKESKYITDVVGRKHYFGEMVETKTILPLKKSNYCGVDIYINNNPDKLLSHLYGDYMQVPPPEKRESHHAVKVFIPNEFLG